jgi:hypothetical protein
LVCDEAPGRDHAGAQQGCNDPAQRLQSRRAENPAGVFQFGMDGGECRLQLLIGRRQIDGEKRDQQYPQGAIEHERRPGIAQE